MSVSKINIEAVLDKNTKSKMQTELDKIKNLKINVNVDTSSIKSNIEKAIKDSIKDLSFDGINLSINTKDYSDGIDNLNAQLEKMGSLIEEIASKSKESSDSIKSSFDFKDILSGMWNDLGGWNLIFDKFKNFGRPKMFGLKLLMF